LARETDTVWGFFNPLWNDATPDYDFFTQRPLLAHYTTMGTLEKIVSSNQMWFSNPLVMNDVEEVRFGINEGTISLVQNSRIREALGNQHDAFQSALLDARERFDSQHAFDTYVLCLSEHDEGDADGLLSMWRGYGDGGRGVAIVFDARAIAEVKDTPLVISKVAYGSRYQRMEWFTRAGDSFASILVANQIAPDELGVAVAALFSRLRSFSLFTKHTGFREEREWRLAYLPERDGTAALKKHLGYQNGARGVEPKLKLPIEPMPEIGGGAPFSLEGIVHSIMLGPSNSSHLALTSTQRMLHALGRPELAKRVHASGIPYRALP
jgi:hypothetical protein